MTEQDKDLMDERMSTPAAQTSVRKAVAFSIALVIMFVIAIGITSTTIGILARPGADPGSMQANKAPAD
ncbi:hypothetical protein [Novosphingobium sp. Leaf2]|uniref:hypothetical protein n=1 Tax=Novosphingobium sp. Leaf2 TaxID=1735670 RepID=UPI0006F59841|nr:hypothetical protein [Novosphingobium sp. Leaf2]KQM19462.1 hypothetical protein ASE49_04330 [Novosphingobium sp. Leaf2]